MAIDRSRTGSGVLHLIRRILLAPLAIALSFVLAVGTRAHTFAQTTEHAGVRSAIAAYEAGEFSTALQLLDGLPVSLPSEDQAVRLVYRGLCLFALGAQDSAAVDFGRAIRADPRIRLDDQVHAPNRVALFRVARDAVIGTWRTDATRAQASGDTATAIRNWAMILQADPSDAEARARHDALQQAQVRAPPDSVVAEPRPTQPAGPATSPVVQTLDPGRAAMLGLAVPGLGELYVGNRLRGYAILGASVSALALGIGVKRVEIDCRSPLVDGTCPADAVADERRRRPYLVAGIGFAAVATLLGAVDAALTADRTNRQAQGTQTGALLWGPHLRAHGSRLALELVRIRF